MNNQDYFKQVSEKYQNGAWINNPTINQVNLAISAGFIGCTTNPTYTAKMLNSPTDGERVKKDLMETIKETDDDSKAAQILQRKTIVPLLEKFLPLFSKSSGSNGFVSMQGDPFAESDPDVIINEALIDMKLGKNVIAKIPVTQSGLTAIEYLSAKNIPIIATEIMSISQMIRVCETYQKATYGKEHKPALYVTHITGIFDAFLKNRVKETGVDIPKEIIDIAGLMVARKQYKMMKERNYPGILLGGGARSLRHFTGLVGEKADVTINWKGTADLLIEKSPEIEDNLHQPIDTEAVNTLKKLIPEYTLAYEADALPVDDFEDYGPVTLFRNAFINGWQQTLDAIKLARS